jgi:uncharacterized protein (DUF1330 family)
VVAYVLVDVEVLAETPGYQELAEESIRRYGGSYHTRGQLPQEILEGDWPAARRVTLFEFPDADRARAWYASAEYQAALALRKGAMDLNMLLVNGVERQPWS